MHVFPLDKEQNKNKAKNKKNTTIFIQICFHETDIYNIW